MKTFEEHWQEIEKNFNFQKVYAAMKALDWVWAIDGKHAIPSVSTIKSKAIEIAKDAYEQCMEFNHPYWSIATAGFKVEFNRDEDFLRLSFILEDWETN